MRIPKIFVYLYELNFILLRKKKITKAKNTSRKKKATVKKQKVARTRNLNTLTESEYFSKIRSGLRNAFKFWKPMQEALKKASRPS